MNKANLQRMADHIRTIPQEKFYMTDFRQGDMKTPECNSIGCAVGHCTVLDADNVMKNFIDHNFNINFGKWSEQFTGLIWNNAEWDWCFGMEWFLTDNTPEGAAKRIEYLLNKELPDNWRGIMYGELPLPY